MFRQPRILLDQNQFQLFRLALEHRSSLSEVILINSIGVAVLADVACIVLTEKAALDNDALNRAKQNDVIILRTDKNSYQMAAAISKMI